MARGIDQLFEGRVAGSDRRQLDDPQVADPPRDRNGLAPGNERHPEPLLREPVGNPQGAPPMTNPEQVLNIEQDGAAHGENPIADQAECVFRSPATTAARRRAAIGMSCSSLTRRRAAAAKAARLTRSTIKLRTAAAKAGASPGATRRPVTPGITISRMPRPSPAITGKPLACASSNAMPNASLTAGHTYRSEAAKRSAIAAGPITP